MTNTLHVSCCSANYPLHTSRVPVHAMRVYVGGMSSKVQIKQLRLRVGRRLKAAREASGVGTQAQAAKLLSELVGEVIEPSRIGNYEQGLRLPDPIILSHLCEIYRTWPSAIYEFPEAPTSEDEVELLNRYRSTDDRGRKAIHGVADSQPTYSVKRTTNGLETTSTDD